MAEKAEVLRRYLRTFWRINREESEEDTRAEILSEVSFKGANLWLLFFTMILACVGLNMNSPYAIIGAMLMSPLMAPVIGMGFSISTNNWQMFKHCAKNWLLALIISLAASTLYFLVTPFSEATDALVSFSQATIYDILIAFFGGLAAFIGLTRISGIKVLAGVAVATACMPPLSTAGYGLANFHWGYFWGGSYLYLINCIYIGLAVMLLSRYMRYKKLVSFREKPISAKIVYVMAFVMLIPATFFAWQLVKEKNLTANINKFLLENLNTGDRTVLKKNIRLSRNPAEVEVFVAGDILSKKDESLIRSKMKAYGLQNLELVIHNTPNLEQIKAEPDLLKQLILNQGKQIQDQDSIMQSMRLQLDSLVKRPDSLYRDSSKATRSKM